MTTAVLGDWIDPDGDPFFLESAAVDAPDRLSSTAEGIVVFDEAGGVGAGRTVGLSVSDGRDAGNGVLTVSVRAPGDVPLIAEPFVELATAGEEIKIDPLRHVRGGSGTYRLSAVPAKPDVQIVPDFDGGSFRFTSADVRTHYLEYSVTDGTQTATGLVRVDVSAPPDRDTTPITVPHTAFLRVEQPVDVDVLATDIDPTGGVLIVTGITDDAADEGVRVEVVDHRILRITLDRPLATGSTTVGYRVSNGLAEADGQVTLVEVPPPTRRLSPRSPRPTPSPRARATSSTSASSTTTSIPTRCRSRSPPTSTRSRPAGSCSPRATGCGTTRPTRPANSRRRTASWRPTARTRRPR